MEQIGPDHDVVSRLCYSALWVIRIPVLVLREDTVVFANHAMLQVLGFASLDDLTGKSAGRVPRPAGASVMVHEVGDNFPSLGR